MRPPFSSRPSPLAPLVAAAALLGGCADGDAVLLVQVVGGAPGTHQLVVEANVGGAVRALPIPAEPRPLTFPTTFSLQVPSGREGPLSLVVTALNAERTQTRRGGIERPRLARGRTTALTVTLDQVLSDVTVDGGADAAPEGRPVARDDAARHDAGLDAGGGAATVVDARPDAAEGDAAAAIDAPPDGAPREAAAPGDTAPGV